MTDVRERIVSSAYPLFVNRGIRDVSVGEIERVARVSHADFEREFPTRDDLAAECLERREREWTFGVVEAGARARGTTPEERLLAIFDVFDEWFRRDDYEACTFINVLLEMGREHPLGRASAEYLVHIRRIVGTLATEAGLRDPDELALSWHILMKGSIINAVEGDAKAALRAKEMARDLIARHRLVTAPQPASPQLGAIRRWWDDLTASTRVLVVVNGVVITGIGALGLVLPMVP
ncbi:TetR/AcrR family transcriptional regulator [Lysobacter korlensis]|uniref:TetR/AcrR family transcriptional regulator n=1 Tax=Lysobacter korlensis TaxID=553636 RepID=A0ABV6RME0_9GAMM